MRNSPINVVSEPGRHDIEITLDSGACDTVMPTELCSHISLMATAKSRSGFEYEVANGEGLLKNGRTTVLYDDGELKHHEAHCFPVRRRADQGYECTLGRLGGVLRDVDTGHLIPLHRRDNLYVMRAWIKQDDSGFTRRE